MNKVIVIGNLGNDPEVRYTSDGKAVCSFSVATTEKWGQGENRQEKTEWHRVVIWGRSAELAGEWLKKGSKVMCEGKLQTKKWTDKNGNDRYTTEIICFNFENLSPRGDSVSNGYSNPGYETNTSNGNDDDIPF